MGFKHRPFLLKFCFPPHFPPLSLSMQHLCSQASHQISYLCSLISVSSLSGLPYPLLLKRAPPLWFYHKLSTSSSNCLLTLSLKGVRAIMSPTCERLRFVQEQHGCGVKRRAGLPLLSCFFSKSVSNSLSCVLFWGKTP